MKIVFVDDCLDRTRKFKSFYPKSISTTNASSMIELFLSLPKIDFLFLDHDLDSTQEYIPERVEGTGMEIVEWIGIHKPNINKIIVHSCNYYGSLNMTNRLLSFGYDVWQMPFSILELPLLDCPNQ